MKLIMALDNPALAANSVMERPRSIRSSLSCLATLEQMDSLNCDSDTPIEIHEIGIDNGRYYSNVFTHSSL
jgi:hypothetical protein